MRGGLGKALFLFEFREAGMGRSPKKYPLLAKGEEMLERNI